MFCLWKYIERWSAQVRLLHMFFVHIIIHIVKNGTWAGCARCFPVKHSYFAQKHWFIKLKLSSLRHFYIMKSLVITLSTFTFNVISTIFNLILKLFKELQFWGRDVHNTACSVFFLLWWTFDFVDRLTTQWMHLTKIKSTAAINKQTNKQTQISCVHVYFLCWPFSHFSIFSTESQLCLAIIICT